MSSKLQSEGSRVFPESVDGDFTNWQSLTSSSAAFNEYMPILCQAIVISLSCPCPASFFEC